MNSPDPFALALRFALYVDLMLLFGVAMFGLYALSGTERVSRSVLPLKALLIGTASLAVLLSIASIYSLAGTMTGGGIASVDGETLKLIFATPVGTSFQIRFVLLMLALYFAARHWRRPTRALTLTSIFGGAALVTLAWAGHGAAGQGAAGWVQLLADIAHLLAAGVWIGAIFALLVLVARRSSSVTREHLLLTHRGLSVFSVVGSLAVGTMVLTGLVNAWALIGLNRLDALFDTTYGLVLTAKLALFAGMLGLASVNRFRLTPKLESSLAAGEHTLALRDLRRSLGTEALLGVGVLGLVSWLGLLAPPA